MSLFSDMNVESSDDLVSFNTGTIFDLASGRYVEGVDGNWYLNGGLAMHINAFVGPNGGFKSTTANSLIMRSACIYGDSDVLIEDTENSLDKDKPRAYRMAGDLYQASIEDRVLWLNGIDYTLDTLFDFLKSVCKKKEEQKKDYMVETPFFDVNTEKNLRTWKPTYVFVDSISELISVSEEELIGGDKGKSISDANTVYMLDGNKKTMFIHAIRRLCQKYGLVFIGTGHFDKIVQIDQYNPTPKDTTFSLKDWKTTGCGKKLKFLASIYGRTKASLLLDQSKLPVYGGVGGPNKDMMEIELTIERCKTTTAGEALAFVETQFGGIENAITNYHYLRLHDYYGLLGSKQKQQTLFMPNLTISRNTVRELVESNYELRRALEITAQYCYIQNNWVTKGLPYDFSQNANALFDKLQSDKNKAVVSDILNSRGYWTYTKNDRTYMDIFKIIDLCK